MAVACRAAHCGDTEAIRFVEARQAAVVSASDPASRVGLDVLRQGGNAVDAAVATAFALAVTFPEAGNIGGGGFMLVYPGDETEPVVVEYRETAPAAATVDMFREQPAGHDHRSVGVPGTVRGLELAHQRFGRLPWRQLVQPAIRLAHDGFALDEPTAASLNNVLAQVDPSSEFRQVYGKPDDQGQWEPGDPLIQPELATTLDHIAGGADAFYRGPIADQLVAEMRRGGGLITHDDLAGYTAHLRTPIHGTYRGWDVYGPPPPSSGGIVLVEMLNVLENFDLHSLGRWSAETLHLMIETMRRAYADRARYLGDTDFVEIPTHLTTKEYAARLAAEIPLDAATSSEYVTPELAIADEGESTTHFSVIDADGMAVANTYTLERSYGSRVVVRGAGFLLNNEMGDFNPRPGVTSRGGLIGTKANLIEPGKRMLSSMTPILVARQGRPVLVTGSPGGRTIINTVLCVTLNVLEFDMDPPRAVDAPRIHHGWFPDEVRIERALIEKHPVVIERLVEMGHVVRPINQQGSAQTIYVDYDRERILGAADWRVSGAARGD